MNPNVLFYINSKEFKEKLFNIKEILAYKATKSSAKSDNLNRKEYGIYSTNDLESKGIQNK